MLSAVTSCLSTSGKIMSVWLFWRELITVLLAWSFYRRALIVCRCKQSHVCMHVRMCVCIRANMTLYTAYVGMHERCLSNGNERYRGRAHISGGVVMGSVCTQGRACFFRSRVMRGFYRV